MFQIEHLTEVVGPDTAKKMTDIAKKKRKPLDVVLKDIIEKAHDREIGTVKIKTPEVKLEASFYQSSPYDDDGI